MAHFAELDVFKKVIRVLVVDDEDIKNDEGVEVESLGQTYLHEAFGGTWIKTSYNTYRNTHLKGGTSFRKNYAGPGFTYDEIREAFIPPKPYASWTLNEETCDWEPPVARPEGETPNVDYVWNEGTGAWDTWVSPDGVHGFTKVQEGETVEEANERAIAHGDYI